MVTTPGNPNDQLPLTPVVLHILLALADERQGKHGYAVAREVEELTDGQIRMGPGTLYGSFQRMLDAGLIEERRARAGDDDDRRRFYRVTSFGRRVLETDPIGTLPRWTLARFPSIEQTVRKVIKADDSLPVHRRPDAAGACLCHMGSGGALVSIEKARRLLGYQPPVSREGSLRQTLTWVRHARLID